MRDRVYALASTRAHIVTLFKICPAPLWHESQRRGRFDGAPVDLADGYIHFSTGTQLAETARRHFADQDDLVLLAVPADVLGEALRWEPSRGGALFPHLYGPLPVAAVTAVHRLERGADGLLVFPAGGAFAEIRS